MRTITRAMLVGFLAVVFTGCGGIGAPPVSLPAPVTGRIVVSSPNADGNITVIGSAGAVTEDSLVMAINEAEVSFFWDKASALLAGNAYAAVDLPDVCSQTGRSCAYSDETGAFELVIPGEVGDEIILVLIDPDTGAELSDRLTRSVPEGYYAFGAGPVDLATSFDGAFLNMLFSAVSGEVNTIETAELSPWSINPDVVEVGGEGAVGFFVGSQGTAVIDVNDGIGSLFVSTGTEPFVKYILKNDMSPDESYVIPTGIVFDSLYATDGNYKYDIDPEAHYFIISSDTELPSVYFWNVENEGVEGNAGLVIDIEGYFHLGTYQIFSGQLLVEQAAGPATDVAVYIFLSKFKNTIGDQESVALSIFEKYTLEAWLMERESDYLAPDAYIFLPSGAVAGGLAIVPDSANIVVTDSGNDVMYLYKVSKNEEQNLAVELSREFEFENFIDPGHILVASGADSVDTIMFITSQNGNDEEPDSVFTAIAKDGDLGELDFDYKSTPVCLNPHSLAFDDVNNYLYTGCLTSKNVVRMSLSDLLP